MMRVFEATIAGVVLIAAVATLFPPVHISDIDPLPLSDLLVSLDLAGRFRDDAISYNAESIQASIISYLPPAYNCHVEVIGEARSSHGPTAKAPSATASYFIAIPEPREVRVTIW